MPISAVPTYDTFDVPTWTWRGAWSSATAYVFNDAVFSAGSSYICTAAVGPTATAPAADAGHWSIIAQQGATGAQGNQGIQGIQGPTGNTGSTGSQGPAGSTGATGAPGSVWFTGAGAPAGATGIVGDFYLDSATGNYYAKTGASTWTLQGSIKGPTGSTGSQGTQGIQGIQGVAGTPGAVWFSAAGAPAGATGIIGDYYLNTTNGDYYRKTGASTWSLQGNLQGAQGIQGIQGPQGTTGATGSQGPQGATGSTGAQGATGNTGSQGIQGVAGTPGEKWFTGAGAPPGATGIIGDWYLDNTTGDIYEKTGASTWTNRGNIRGPQGVQGNTGAQGIQGIQGPIGNTGPQGPIGNTGPAGPTGNTGATGSQGPIGDTGATGPQGPTGNTGAQGIQGVKGDTGATGVQGPQGTQGVPGPQTRWLGTYSGITTYVINDVVALNGNSYMASANVPPGTAPPAAPWVLIAQKGDVGAQGTTGATGAQGAQGIPGPQGVQGPQGTVGPQGPVGITGAQGTTGATGPQGAPGPQGSVGPQGTPGLPGTAGPQGVQGPQGLQGEQGMAGVGLNVKGTVPTYAALPPQPIPANDAYTVDDTGHLWTSNGTQWVDTGLLRGPQGPMGYPGLQGPMGAQGPIGPQGATGDPGVQGPMGPQGVAGDKGDPGDPFGTPTLAIGVIVHWRPPRSTFDRYGLCKPAIVCEALDVGAGIVNAVVLGSQGSPVLLYDHIPHGVVEGQWHFIADCPYPLGLSSTLTRAFSTLVGAGI